MVFDFFLPVLAGNVAGGTLLFAVLSYGQIAHEI
jgi:formate/nitrite transporter FocA (FNT family)